MWFYKFFSFGYIIFIISVFCEDNMKHHKNNKKQLNVELNIFKNITEAKEKLQGLLKNFKQLEKIYKNYGTTDSNPSESEIDEVFRQISNNNKNKKKHFQKRTLTTTNPSHSYRGTAYIYEYQESSLIGHKDTKEEKEELINTKEEKTVEEDSLENNAKTDVSFEETAGSDQVESKTESDEVVEIKIESGKKNKNKPKSYSNNRGKTRFSVLHSGKENIDVISNKSEKPFKVRSQRIVYSEQFRPQTIWHEIINKPIKLNRVISSEETSKLNSRENESTLGITDNTKAEDTTKTIEEFETRELSNIAKDGNSGLRDGYGDVCIQIPIKKCKKAMKAVNKNVCKRRFKCKSEFKSDFEENLKKECEKKFSYIYPESKESDHNFNRAVKDDNQFLDATRHRDPLIILQNSSFQLSLRDKYEKRCQKESRDKCITACNDASEKTCSKHTCDKKKNKAMTKVCKEECKNIFHTDNKSSKSSEDSSDSDSNSGSDSD